MMPPIMNNITSTKCEDISRQNITLGFNRLDDTLMIVIIIIVLVALILSGGAVAMFHLL